MNAPNAGTWSMTLAALALTAGFAGLLWSASPNAAGLAQEQTAVRAGHHHSDQDANDIPFGPAPAIFPAGAEMAVLQGDPSVAGAIFTVRLRFPNGYILPAHFHPTDEHVTVISGAFRVGMGDTFDPAVLSPPLRPGGFITAPANAHHFAAAKGRTVVQVHAMGPFQLTYVDPADVPRPRR